VNADCPDAYENPRCPYVTQINQHSCDVQQIKQALVGNDLQGGLVAKVQKLESFMKVAVFVSSAAVAATITLLVKVALGV